MPSRVMVLWGDTLGPGLSQGGSASLQRMGRLGGAALSEGEPPLSLGWEQSCWLGPAVGVGAAPTRAFLQLQERTPAMSLLESTWDLEAALVIRGGRGVGRGGGKEGGGTSLKRREGFSSAGTPGRSYSGEGVRRSERRGGGAGGPGQFKLKGGVPAGRRWRSSTGGWEGQSCYSGPLVGARRLLPSIPRSS